METEIRSRKGLASSLLGRSLAVIEPFRVLWVSGLALFLVLVIGALLRFMEPDRLKYLEYVALGTVFPAVAVAVATLPRFTRSTGVPRSIEIVLSVFCLLMAGYFLIRHLNVPVMIVSVIHGATVWAVTRLRARWRRQSALHNATAPDASEASSAVDLPFLLLLLLVTLVSWTAWLQVLPGLRVEDAWSFKWHFGTDFEGWFSRSRFSIPIFLLSLIIVVANLLRVGPDRPLTSRASRIIKHSANSTAVCLFALAAFRTDPLFKNYGSINFDTLLHWSYFVSPAEAMRQGNWLLWDVPSVYGFLGIATVAIVPTEDVWKAFYLVNSSLVLLSAVILFFLLRCLRPGFLNWCLAFGLSFAVVFVLPGNLDIPTGPQIWPSTGGFRFFWAYLLLAIIFIAHGNRQRGHVRFTFLVLGCIIWLVGTLWSFESAVYCTAIWFPAYLLMVWFNALSVDGQKRSLMKRMSRLASWSALPLLLLAVTVCAVTGYYKVMLGNLPDYRAFVEMAVELPKRYEIGWDFDEVAPVALFIVFCITSSACIESVRRARIHALGLICGAWVTLFVGSGYFVAKTDRVTLFLVATTICCAIAVTCLLYRRRDPQSDGWATLITTAYVPVLTVLLATGFGHPETLVRAAHGWSAGYREFRGRLPVLDTSAVELLTSARDKIDCPLVLLDNPLVRVREVDGNECFSHNRGEPPFASWLLAADVLVPERVDVFASRYRARRSWKGYVLLTKESKRDPKSHTRIGVLKSDFLEQLVRPLVSRRVAANADYELVGVEMGEATLQTRAPDLPVRRDFTFGGLRSPMP
jgi:hypothetical protein